MHTELEIVPLEGALLGFVSPPYVQTICSKFPEWLTPTELARFQGLHAESRRRDWLAGRLAAKALLQHTWPKLSFAQIEIANDEAGAPVVRLLGNHSERDCALSISHSEGYGLAGLAWKGCIGVDLQKIRPVRSELSERVLSERERKHLAQAPGGDAGLILYWALKEATIKAHRLRPAPLWREIEISLSESHQAEVVLEGQKLSARWGERDDFLWACVRS